MIDTSNNKERNEKIMALHGILQRISGWSTKRKVLAGIAALIVISFVIGGISSVFESEESKQAKVDATVTAVAVKEAEVAAKAIVEAEEQASGLHCLSDLNGRHRGFERLVKRDGNLRDPNSLESQNTWIVRVGEPLNLPDVAQVDGREGHHIIILDFTATNAFGGRVRSEAVGYVDNATCDATVLISVN